MVDFSWFPSIKRFDTGFYFDERIEYSWFMKFNKSWETLLNDDEILISCIDFSRIID